MGFWQRLNAYRNSSPSPATQNAFSYGVWKWLAEGSAKRLIRDTSVLVGSWLLLRWRSGEAVATEEQKYVIPVFLFLTAAEAAVLFWYLITSPSEQRDLLRAELRIRDGKLQAYEMPEEKRSDSKARNLLFYKERLSQKLDAVRYMLDSYPKISQHTSDDWVSQAKELIENYETDIKRLAMPDIVEAMARISSRESTREPLREKCYSREEPGHYYPTLVLHEVRIEDALEAITGVQGRGAPEVPTT